MIMFGSFLPSLSWLAPPKFTRAWEPTLLWNHYTHNRVLSVIACFRQRYLSSNLQTELASNHALEARAGVQCSPVSKSKRKCQLMTKFQLGRLASAIARCRPISQGETFMKLTQTLNFVKFAACMVLVVGLSASALASCGDSLSAMEAGAASVHSQSRPMQQNSQSAGDNSGKSMVGLWHIQFTVGGQTIQEAYQLWNAGGTEGHNPNVDPRGGSVCLGVWKHASHGAYKLAHRVWSYDTS